MVATLFRTVFKRPSMSGLAPSLALDQQTNRRVRRRRKKKGKSKESETCELRVPKTRPVKFLTGGFPLC